MISDWSEDEAPKKQGSLKKWLFVGLFVLLGGVSLLGLGKCVKGFEDLYAFSEERKTATSQLLETLFEDWDPQKISRVWTSEFEIQDSELAALMEFGSRLGEAAQTPEPECLGRTHFGTGELNGVFVDCTISVEHKEAAGKYLIGWLKEEEAWVLYSFKITVKDTATMMRIMEGSNQTTEAVD